MSLSNLLNNPMDTTNDLLRLLVMRAENSTLNAADLYPSVTPPPGSTRQNCLFFASLCCSLQAAAGAILARQWLQFYTRPSQTGSLESQGRKFTVKTDGAVTWRLETVIELLPTILQVSVTLFFAGLIDFLWPISHAVAGIVMGFTFMGVIFFTFSIIASHISPRCPYKTGLTSLVPVVWSLAYPVRWIALQLGWLFVRAVVLLVPVFLAPFAALCCIPVTLLCESLRYSAWSSVFLKPWH